MYVNESYYSVNALQYVSRAKKSVCSLCCANQDTYPMITFPFNLNENQKIETVMFQEIHFLILCGIHSGTFMLSEKWSNNKQNKLTIIIYCQFNK